MKLCPCGFPSVTIDLQLGPGSRHVVSELTNVPSSGTMFSFQLYPYSVPGFTHGLSVSKLYWQSAFRPLRVSAEDLLSDRESRMDGKF